MLTVKQFFHACGLDVDPDKIRMAKHVDNTDSVSRMIDAEEFDYYQQVQRPHVKPFHNADYLLSFIGLPDKLAEFWGGYRITGVRDFTAEDYEEFARRLPNHVDGLDRIWYDLEEDMTLRPWRHRLVVHWPSTRGWFQAKDVDLFEVRPPDRMLDFPGYENILLSWKHLRAIFNYPNAHRDWQSALSANAGIYRIVDISTGEMYIGSAYGAEGLWGRWRTYSKSGHGGNRMLKDRDPANFQWSVIRTVSTTMSKREVIRIESLEKRKHGSRAIGLNVN